MRKKLAIISSHPIQYNAPMFAMLAKSKLLDSKVFYTWSQSKDSLFDKDFGKKIEWDIPLLEGYEYEFIQNIATDPGPHHRKGIDCPDLIRKIEEWGADAILIYGWNYKAHFKTMRYFKGKTPIYFRGDSTLIDEKPGLKKMLRRNYLRWVYQFTDYAFYVGKNNKEYFIKHGLKEENLFFAPHAIDNKRFSDLDGKYKKQAQKYLAEFNIDKNKIVVLFAGKFESKKNPLILIQAAQELNKDIFSFVFVGNGELEEEMKKASNGMKNIYFMPFMNQSEIPAVYYMADILALPSQGPGETWGLVVNEAMACSKAILVSDKAGCFSDLVHDDENGCIFSSGNLDQCISSLKQMDDKESVLKMGKKSAQMIKDWSFKQIVISLERHIK